MSRISSVCTAVSSGHILVSFKADGSSICWEVSRKCHHHRMEFRLKRTELQNEFCMDAACLGHMLADLSVGLRSTAVCEVEEVVSQVFRNPLMQSGGPFSELPIRFLQSGDSFRQLSMRFHDG